MRHAVLVWLFGCAWISVNGAEGVDGYIPKDDSAILVHLRTAPKENAELRILRTQLEINPRDISAAVALARLYLQMRRERSDPRFLGLAQGAISQWWDDPNPPHEIFVLRASINQSNHKFREALVDLNAAIRINPRDAQAWLTMISVHQVLGEYREAVAGVIPLSHLASSLVSITVATELASLQGRAQGCLEILKDALERSTGDSAEVKAWAWGTFAEIAMRTGEAARADEGFAKALAASPDDYLRGAQSDFWLDQARAPEALAALRDHLSTDALLLRYALALKQTQSPDLPKVVAELRDRIDASRHRTGNLHAREESRFLLELGGDKKRALELAKTNWGVQHEPADVRLLLECALACEDKLAADPALEWVATTKLEDNSLKPIMEGLAKLP